MSSVSIDIPQDLLSCGTFYRLRYQDLLSRSLFIRLISVDLIQSVEGLAIALFIHSLDCSEWGIATGRSLLQEGWWTGNLYRGRYLFGRSQLIDPT